jgi:hypothetical protein
MPKGIVGGLMALGFDIFELRDGDAAKGVEEEVLVDALLNDEGGPVGGVGDFEVVGEPKGLNGEGGLEDVVLVDLVKDGPIGGVSGRGH